MHFEKREFFELYEAFASLSLMPAPQNGWFLLTPVLKKSVFGITSIQRNLAAVASLSMQKKTPKNGEIPSFFPW